MPPMKDKEATMACKLSEETVFIRKQEGLRADCSDILCQHLTANPDVIWETKDGAGSTPRTKREKAKLKLVLDVTFSKETGKPIFPPPNTRLSDELVYLATKFETGPVRAVRYPYDFDKSGDIDPDRVPSGPAPIIWAHGLPFFPVYKGYYILCGRDHAECIGWLLHEKTRILIHKSPMWSIGGVIAPDSAIKLPHTIERQMILHKPQGIEKDLRYKGKAWTRDIVTAEHHLCAVFPNLGAEEIDVCPLWKAEGYNVYCGPPQRDVKPTFMPKEFFARHGIVNIDYATLARPYSNECFDSDDEELDEEKDTDKNESGDVPGSCGEVTSNDDQPVNTHSASQMDVDMEIDSAADVPQMVPEQEQMSEAITKQVPAQVPNQSSEQPEKSPEEATDVVMKQGPEDINEDHGDAHSSLEDNPAVDSSAIASPGHDMSMTVEDLNIEVSDSIAPRQNDTAAILSKDTNMSTEDAAAIQTTSVQPTAEHFESEQPEAVPTSQISTSEPVTMEQVAHEQSGSDKPYHPAAGDLPEKPNFAEQPETEQPEADSIDEISTSGPVIMGQAGHEQPDSEKSYHTTTDDVPEKPSFAEHPTAQSVPDDENQISAKASVEDGD